MPLGQWPYNGRMRQQWGDYRAFWREFRQTFETTGAVLPSGPGLSAALARYVREGGTPAPARSRGERDHSLSPGPFPRGEAAANGRRILEVGPGTGAATGYIVRALRPGDRLELVERNEQFVERLRARLESDAELKPFAERITLHHAGVEELPEEEPYHVIVSGLPLNNFSVSLVEELVGKLCRLLAPGGTLSFFEYIAVRRLKAAFSRRAERERLRGVGRVLGELLAAHEIRRDRVLANVPPAWVHHVRMDRR